MESNPGFGRVDFAILRNRVRNAVILRINNGEFTERGFARILGISQPQVHNVLKGARRLSPEIADLILAKLDLSVIDLLTEAEITARVPTHTGVIPRKPPQADVLWKRVANGTLGNRTRD